MAKFSYNIASDIVYHRWFQRPAVVNVYMCVYENAILRGGHTYTSHGCSISLDRDQSVCSRSYIAAKLDIDDNTVKSALRTLEDYGYIIKVAQDKIEEGVYKVPAICDSIAGAFTRLELPDVQMLWSRGKYLLSTLLYIGVSANAEDSRDCLAKTICDDCVVARGSQLSSYKKICNFVGCRYDEARAAIAKLKDMQLITCTGFKRLGLLIKFAGYTVIDEVKKVTEQVKKTVVQAVKNIVKPADAPVELTKPVQEQEKPAPDSDVLKGVAYYAGMLGWTNENNIKRYTEDARILTIRIGKDLPLLDKSKVLQYFEKYYNDYHSSQDYKGKHYNHMNHAAYFDIVKGYYEEERQQKMDVALTASASADNRKDNRKERLVADVLENYLNETWIKDIVITVCDDHTDIVLPCKDNFDWMMKHKDVLNIVARYYRIVKFQTK